MRLAVEVDGKIHGQEEAKKNDIERAATLQAYDPAIIRFTNEEALTQIEKVIQTKTSLNSIEDLVTTRAARQT